jgi:hypothetical protein
MPLCWRRLLVNAGVQSTTSNPLMNGCPSIVLESIEGNLDQGDQQGNQCLGSGRAVDDREHVLDMLRQVITDFQDDLHPGWSDEKVNAAELLEYSRADVGGKEVVFSKSYARTSTRVSYNVFARYEESVRGAPATKEYVCTVLRFVKATAPGCPPIRFAVSDLHVLSKSWRELWPAVGCQGF